MISLKKLQEFTKKHQTDFRNIAREYVEHQFLSFCYQNPQAGQLLFKGGTALRIIYQSPRFSEDLDYSGQNIYSYRLIEDVFIETIHQLEKLGLSIQLAQAKPTTGGYLGIISYQIYEISDQIKFEISLRRGQKMKSEMSMIVSEYSPAYSIIHLGGEQIVKSKMAALLDRQKPRDYYDLYFFLRHPELHKYITKQDLKQSKDILSKTRINFKTELSALLPHSHQMILKNFKSLLIKEIKKFL